MLLKCYAVILRCLQFANKPTTLGSNVIIIQSIELLIIC